MTRRRITLIALIVSASGCTSMPRPNLSVPTPGPIQAGEIRPEFGPTQRIVAAKAVPSKWWTNFASAELNAAVDEALAHNNDLSVAEATLKQAREQRAIASGSQGPQVDAGYQAQRVRASQTFANPLPDPNAYLYSLHTAQLTVSYPVDIFGAGRAHVRSATAAAEAAANRLAAARTTVAANLVLAVIQRGSLILQIDATKASIRTNQELLDLLEKRRSLGEVGLADVSAQQTALAAAEGQLPLLQRQLTHEEGLIALLIGRAPGTALPALPDLETLRLPANIPVGLPADIIAHRPDVRAAEAQVRGAAADLGAAIAARLPSLQLTGSAGGSATEFSRLLAQDNLFFSLAGSITAPLFHSRQLLHQKRAAQAALEITEAQYRTAALQAFLDVDDALAGLKTDAQALDAAVRGTKAARQALGLVQRQVELGSQGTLALLNAEAAASVASLQFIQAEASRLSDTVAFYQACGTAP